tara:strand:- start:5149 stop:5331 length:183 start_codon:yes stop_codon:yes gene_type:complete
MKNLLQKQFFRVSEMKILILCFCMLYISVDAAAESPNIRIDEDITVSGQVTDETVKVFLE